MSGKAPPDRPAFQPHWGKPAVRNERGDRGNVGIIRSPVRASILPDCMRFERWLVVSRSLWLVGVRGQATETFGAAWSRSKVAYGRLLEAGAERGVVALVGHNFFSRCLAWHARAEGWRLTERSGSGYLSSSVY